MPAPVGTANEKGWRPWKLKWWCTFLVIFCQAGVLATIIALAIISSTSDGFVTVSNAPLTTVAGQTVHQQLLWTSLPAFLVALLNIAYAMIANSSAERQPYVELVGTPKRSNAKMTLMLDYASYPVFYNWIVAFKNRHWHLGGALLVYFLCSFSLVPLTGGLFRAAETTRIHPVALQGLNHVDFDVLSEQTNLQPAMDLAGAIHAYGAQSPTWTTTKYAFDPFVTEQPPKAGNISATTSAYHVEPNCRIIDLSSAGNSTGNGSTSFRFTDRGCPVDTTRWPSIPVRRSYTYTWYQFCGDGSFRLGLFAGIYSAGQTGNLRNATVVSCLPELFNTTIRLSMSFASLGAQRFLNSSEEDEPVSIDLEAFRTMNSNLPLYRLSGFSGDFKSDTFGNAVHSYAHILSPGAEFREAVYLTATEQVYTTLVAMLANTALLQPRTQEQVLHLAGLQSTTTQRLYVSIPVAAVICTLLTFTIICTTWLAVYVQQHSSVLTEDATGLLGRALVLNRSTEVTDFASKLEREYTAGQRMRGVKRDFTWKQSTCWVEGEVDSANRRIRLQGLRAARPGAS